MAHFKRHLSYLPLLARATVYHLPWYFHKLRSVPHGSFDQMSWSAAVPRASVTCCAHLSFLCLGLAGRMSRCIDKRQCFLSQHFHHWQRPPQFSLFNNSSIGNDWYPPAYHCRSARGWSHSGKSALWSSYHASRHILSKISQGPNGVKDIGKK